MNTTRNFVKIAVVFLVLTFLFVGYRLYEYQVKRVYNWNQLVTIVVETDTDTYQNSTVQQVTWQRNWFRVQGLESKLWSLRIEGEAPHVVLPNNAVIVATMGGETRWGFGRLLVEQLEGSQVNRLMPPNEDVVRRTADASDVKAKVVSPAHAFPTIMGFTSADNPESAFWVSSTTPASQALGINSVEVIVQKTRETVSQPRIAEVLPWLIEMDSSSRVIFEFDNEELGRISPSAFVENE